LAGRSAAGQDRCVTEPHSPLDAALDLLVYAPFGLALTAAEEIPKLAAKGRAQLGGQVAMARVVGQFAVSQGRKELHRRFAPTRPDAPAATSPAAPAAPASAAASAVADVADGGTADVSFEELLATPQQDGGTGDGAAGGAIPQTGAVPDPGAPKPSPDGLAIPGYDSLAASQVVQRLAGLSADELAAVGAYESTHRARRTILSRVRQLQDR
jgi:hypothetical protein